MTESGIIHHERPGSRKPKIYLEKLIYQGSGRFGDPDHVPEAGTTTSFKGKNQKRQFQIPSSHNAIWREVAGDFPLWYTFSLLGTCAVWQPRFSFGQPLRRGLNVCGLASFSTLMHGGWRLQPSLRKL